MSIETTTRVIRLERLQAAKVDDDIVILNMKTSSYVALDEIGRRIWELLETPMLVSNACRQLSREFNAPAGQIEADVISFLNELQAEGLVQVVEN